MSDADLIRILGTKVKDFKFEMDENGNCISLDLTSKDWVLGGLIRLYSNLEKREITKLISGLSSLKKLNLRRNKLQFSPEEFDSLGNLEWLDLGSNYINSQPLFLKSLKKLKYLNLANNLLTEIPASIYELTDLETLSIHKNVAFTYLDEKLLKLTKLTSLNLYLSQLKELPAFIYKMVKLRNLVVWDIKNLSDDICKLENLEYFTNNGCTSMQYLPEGFTKLKRLKAARIYQNSLVALPENIGDLESLEQLSVYQNQLSDLPLSFGKLHKLEKLNLGWNNFAKIPEPVLSLPSIKWLGFFNNPVEKKTSGNFKVLYEREL